jgi:hypothetical protein
VIGWGDLFLPEMNTQLWGTSNTFVGAMYYRIFYQVGLANEFLRQTTDAKLDSRGQTSSSLRTEVATYRAEARFLRALSYWHGIDLFGSIPLFTEDDVVGVPPPQASRAEVYDFIVSELNAIINDLPQPGASTYGRATSPAAQMLLATLYLNAGVYTGTPNYAGALTAASAVIGGPYSLNPVYRNNFLADNHTSPEIIFAITQDGLRTQTWGGMTFLIHASCGGNMSPVPYGINGCWWGLRLKNASYTRYASGDGRTGYFFLDASQSDSVSAISNWFAGIPAPKYSNVTSTGQPGSNATHVDTDFPMLRLADAYLMYVEAYLRGGGGTEAQALIYFNALRQRAFGNTNANLPTGVLAVGSAAALDTVLAERGRELLWEAHRRTDLVRYGRFTGGSYLWEWKGNVRAGTPTPSYRDLYPIPDNELIANPNLRQNPGY